MRALSRTAPAVCSASSRRSARVTAISDSPRRRYRRAVDHHHSAVRACRPGDLGEQRPAFAHPLELLAGEVRQQQLDQRAVGTAHAQMKQGLGGLARRR